MPQETVIEEVEEGLGPGLDRHTVINGRLEHSRITGEYYRDLATNYGFYEEQAEIYKRTGGDHGERWPSHPFPNENYANYAH